VRSDDAARHARDARADAGPSRSLEEDGGDHGSEEAGGGDEEAHAHDGRDGSARSRQGQRRRCRTQVRWQPGLSNPSRLGRADLFATSKPAVLGTRSQPPGYRGARENGPGSKRRETGLAGPLLIEPNQGRGVKSRSIFAIHFLRVGSRAAKFPRWLPSVDPVGGFFSSSAATTHATPVRPRGSPSAPGGEGVGGAHRGYWGFQRRGVDGSPRCDRRRRPSAAVG